MLLHPCAAAVWVISLLGVAAAAAELEGELAHRLEAIVRIHADVPAEARTAAYLGTTRDGAGVVIDDADRIGARIDREDAGGGRRLRWAGGGAAGGRGVAPNLRRLLGVSAGRRHIHRAATSCLERGCVARTRRQACRDRLPDRW